MSATETEPALKVGNAVDITHQRAAEQQQIELEGQLLQAQKMEAVGQLASGIAHDLNNVLTVVQGHALLLADPDETPEDRAEWLEALDDAFGQAHGVTSSLLNLRVRARGRAAPVRPGRRRARNGVAAAPDPVGERQVRNTRAGGRELKVLGDRTRLLQVVLNLALNARDAMPEGGQLVVRVGEAVTHGGRGKLVRMTVSDTGSGIPEDALEHLFEPFFNTKERGRGTGLSLSVALGIVRDHEGEIRVDSEVGKGTRFMIDLPRLEQDSALESDISQNKPDPVPASCSPRIPTASASS